MDCVDDIEVISVSTNDQGIFNGEIYTDDYQYISIQAYCTVCEGTSHFTEALELLFEIKVWSERFDDWTLLLNID